MRLLKLDSEGKPTLLTFPTLDPSPSYYALSYTWGTSVDEEALSGIDTNLPIRAARHRVHHTLGDGEIRVLELLPGVSDLIECELLTTTLRESGDYESLSYVWGHAIYSAVVLVNGTEREVTPSLEHALRRLRHPTKRRRLWIDQLCISQWDKAEKRRQVNLMQDIYKSCKKCLIWFGEINNERDGFTVHDGQAALDLLNWTYTGGFFEGIDTPSTLRSDTGFKGALKAFKSMILNPWWSRIWTVQELVLPPRAVIIWGSLSVPFEVLETTALNMCHGHFPNNLRLHSCFELFWDIVGDFTESVRSLDIAKSGESPLDVLHRWQYRDATEPLDKVYALMGLFTSVPFPSIPSCDYEVPVNTIYTRATLDLIRQENGLRPLIGSRWKPRLTPDLPTWSLDLMRHPDSGGRCWTWRNYSHRYGCFRADSGRKLAFKSLDNDAILSLIGVCVDKIMNISGKGQKTRCELNDEHFNRMFSEWEQMLEEHVSQGATSPYPKGTTVRDACWGNMVGNIYLESLPSRYTTDTDCAQNDVSHKAKSQDNLCSLLRPIVLDQSFFITTSGYMGFGPSTIEENDEVWILHGGRVPFVLRPTARRVPGSNSSGLTEHELVGDAYVHGIMDGEAEARLRADQEHILLI